MNRKQFVILLILVVVIGGIGLAVYNKNDSSYQGASRTGQKLLGDFDVNQVAHIVIKEQDKELNLVKTDKGWTVKERGNYPANFETIKEFVQKAADMKVIQTLPVGPSQWARLELAEPGKSKSGTLLQFKGANGQVLKSVQLGVKHMKEQADAQMPTGGFADAKWPDGRYVITDRSEGKVSLVSEPLSQAAPEPQTWLNKDFFKIEKVKSISVTYPEATNSWALWRMGERDTWKLQSPNKGEELDTNKVSSVANSLSYPSFNDIAVDKKPETTGLDKPTVVKIETLDNFNYTLNIGKAFPDDTYPATVSVAADIPKARDSKPDEKKEDKEKLDKEFKEKNEKLTEKFNQEKALEGWVYLIPKYTLESILKKRAELMVEKKEEKTAEKTEDKKDEKAGETAKAEGKAEAKKETKTPDLP